MLKTNSHLISSGLCIVETIFLSYVKLTLLIRCCQMIPGSNEIILITTPQSRLQSYFDILGHSNGKLRG